MFDYAQLDDILDKMVDMTQENIDEWTRTGKMSKDAAEIACMTLSVAYTRLNEQSNKPRQ